MVSVIIQNVIMLIVIIQNVIMLSVVIHNFLLYTRNLLSNPSKFCRKNGILKNIFPKFHYSVYSIRWMAPAVQ